MDTALLNRLSKEYELEPALIQAVAKVESDGKSGFQKKTGLLTILFEAHLFYKELYKKFVRKGTSASIQHFRQLVKENPDLISASWNPKLYSYGDGENIRMARALKLDPCAALCASYGQFQILGMHYALLGFSTVDEYIHFLNQSGDNHLILFLRFLETNPVMLGHLRAKRWAKFAALYNGPGYRKNNYDVKLAEAYAYYSKQYATS